MSTVGRVLRHWILKSEVFKMGLNKKVIVEPIFSLDKTFTLGILKGTKLRDLF